MTPSECPTAFALEQLLSGELHGDQEAALKQHVQQCARCSEQLSAMEQQAKAFSASPRSAPAKAAFLRADRAWKRKAMFAVTLPVAAVLVAAVSPTLFKSDAPKTQWAAVHARSTTVLEPRGGEGPARLRTISLRGHDVAFGLGELEAAVGDAPSKPFVLKHTDVDAEVSGFVESVTVTQEFENPFNEPVEAVYIFPLPDDSAVDEMTLVAGGRTIRAQIQKREQARRIYEEAKAQGRRAALLDQERPNIFTQSVANLLPHETVKVTLHYVAKLAYDDGQYTFNFPMTVGPRYIGGAALAGESQGSGTHADTTEVIDASRISPPLERTGRDIAVRVRLDAGLPIEDLVSVSHRLRLESPTEHEATVTLDPSDRIPNKDLILRWRVAGATKRAAVLATGGEGGTFAMMLSPESAETRSPALPKEIVFLIDTSCSMGGAPLDAAKAAMGLAMQQMGPNDTFMLLDFADTVSSFHNTPLPNTPMHVQRALAYLRSLPASGGTNQLQGIRVALTLPPDERRLREVLLMTDGFIGDERSILAEEDTHLGTSRVFAFGIGTSVNHYLLSRMSENGRGFYQYVRPDEKPDAAVSRFVKRINRPMLTDVTVTASGTELFDLLPKHVPDLFDAQPLVVLGRYRNAGKVRFTVSGKQGRVPVSFDVDAEIPTQMSQGHGLRQLWARAKIEELDAQQHFGERSDVIGDITTLGLEHHLVTAYTSLVAVEDRVVARPGPTKQVSVPNETPDKVTGVDTGTTLDWTGKEGDVDGKDTWNGATTTPAPAPPAPAPPAMMPVMKPPPMSGTTRAQRVTIYKGEPATKTDEDGRYHLDGHGKGDVGGAEGGVTGGYYQQPAGKTGTGYDGDDDFDSSFGVDDHKGKGDKIDLPPAAHRSTKHDSVHIPPMQGSAGDTVKDALGQSDIMEVVLANKAGLIRCVDEQHQRDPKLTGKVVMKWIILPNGRVARVELVSEEFRSTHLAKCLTELIKTWVFPRSNTPGDPVIFPFKF